MAKLSKKAILSAKDSIKSAKDSVKNAQDKLTKIAQDMGTTEVAPDPEQVKEIVESIADVAKEIVQQADMVTQGLEQVIEPETTDETVQGREQLDENGDPIKKPIVATMDEETKDKMDAQEEKIEDLTKFKEDSEKEKMASEYANLFDVKVRSAKFTEFMKMDQPNSELKTVLSATENALKSLTKVASMPGQRKSNETIIFNDTKQKNASMGDFSGNAKTLSEI